MSDFKYGDKVVYRKTAKPAIFHVISVNGNGSLNLQGPRRTRPAVKAERVRHATPDEIQKWG